jgi:predicted nucleic acid-binding protein
MDRVFLDANVLFSAAYTQSSSLHRIWRLDDVELVSSDYAVEEARRNIMRVRPQCRTTLERLIRHLVVISCVCADSLPDDVELDDKDRPILAAAIEARASHLLTGDKTHFGHLFGQTIRGVLIVTSGEYLRGST